MTNKETQCTGCGATVTQDSELYWRDSGGYKSCSPATGSSGLHRIEEEDLPPVAIKPEAPQEGIIKDDAVYLKYAAEYKALLDSLQRSFVGKAAQIENYNASIDGRIGEITSVRIGLDGNFWFHLDDGGFGFEPEYLRLVEFKAVQE